MNSPASSSQSNSANQNASPRRILYFSRDYTPHDHRFLTSLAQAGYETFYLRLEQRGASREDRPLPPEVTIVQWAGGRGRVTWRNGPGLMISLREVIGRFRPDLIHAGPIQTAGLLTALSGFHPFVAASWGYDLLLDAEKNSLWRRATRFTLNRADVLIADCETIRRRAMDYGFSGEKIVTFPWGIDLQAYTPRPSTNEPDQDPGDKAGRNAPPALRTRLGWEECFVLISTRAWEPIYGVEEIARAFTRAARAKPDLRLLMLGAGSQAQRLREIFLRGGVMEKVRLPGQVSQDELPRYFRSADLYVSASHSDGTSISLLEALASGLPALVSDIPGNREWITPGEQGWLFPLGDVERLARAILQAESSRDDLARLGKAARTRAEARADWNQNFIKLQEAYQMTVSGSA